MKIVCQSLFGCSSFELNFFSSSLDKTLTWHKGSTLYTVHTCHFRTFFGSIKNIHRSFIFYSPCYTFKIIESELFICLFAWLTNMGRTSPSGQVPDEIHACLQGHAGCQRVGPSWDARRRHGGSLRGSVRAPTKTFTPLPRLSCPSSWGLLSRTHKNTLLHLQGNARHH
jgi:hypothetical protein